METVTPPAEKPFISPTLRKQHLQNYPDIAITRFLDVDYLHVKCSNGGDLYVTRYGLPLIEHIKPESWYEQQWFRTNREKLQGTSTVYRVTSKKIRGQSADLIVKWSRVGQQVPLETKIIEDVLNAEFNSPFEEFSLVEELRGRLRFQDSDDMHVSLQKPLGIYVPPEQLQLWQTGRSKHKIRNKLTQHPGVEIDILRQYILIYKWVKGIDAVEAYQQAGIPDERLAAFTDGVTDCLRTMGFMVLDQKPAHFIMRMRPDSSIMKTKDAATPFALVDFELLQRTPEHDAEVKKIRRANYLVRQRDRFKKERTAPWPRHLHPITIMGVDYVWGVAESTGGMLWVAGDDPDLFDYFLPERWRKTPHTSLSPQSDIYYTKTKDNINVVWKVSRVGERPSAEFIEHGQEMIAHGFNSPFEKFSFAFELSNKGIATVYPRAIYMTGNPADPVESPADPSRFASHRHLRTPVDTPVLDPHHDYITLWGFWNGLDENLAARDAEYCTGISALNAFRRALITELELCELIEQVKALLGANGLEDLALRGNHILLSLSPQGKLLRDAKGRLEIRLCNFEFIRRCGC